MNSERIVNSVLNMRDEIIGNRRHFHMFPEVSSNEINTSKYLKQYMSDLGLEPISVEGTGFYAILDSGRKGKTVGLRTDIDALPMQEASTNLIKEREVISSNDGVMHACGHDGHMAIELAVAKYFVEHIDDINGKVVFIFEEAEETGAGIRPMLNALKDITFDVIYGTHLAAFMDVGKLSIEAGPRMAGGYFFEFDVIGRGGHGSRPDLAINPIFAGTQIINNLSSVWVNQLDVTKTVTLGISKVQAGTALNIIPEICTIGGSIRFFDASIGIVARDLIYKVAQETAEIYKCKVDIKPEVRNIPVINDDFYSERARDSVTQLYGDVLEDGHLWFGSESFAEYRELAPIVFMFSGIKNDELGSGADHHNLHFDMDEEALLYSASSTIKIISDVLKGE